MNKVAKLHTVVQQPSRLKVKQTVSWVFLLAVSQGNNLRNVGKGSTIEVEDTTVYSSRVTVVKADFCTR